MERLVIVRPEFRSQSRDSSVERPRDREPQPSMSGCANAALGPILVPQARNGQPLESGDSDDESIDRELSGEVRTVQHTQLKGKCSSRCTLESYAS